MLIGDLLSRQLAVNLHFQSLEDFEPAKVAQQIKPLKELMDLRTKLSDLRGTLQGNDKLDEILQETLRNSDKLGRLKSEVQTKGEDNE